MTSSLAPRFSITHHFRSIISRGGATNCSVFAGVKGWGMNEGYRETDTEGESSIIWHPHLANSVPPLPQFYSANATPLLLKSFPPPITFMPI
ncbi:hypothetical protein D0Y65_006499 [Glycine soja]|nr:hypothetical protein D0Y65_006499 [Glycine soja]